MCSADEVQKIVDKAISELEHRQDEKLNTSHMAVAKSVSAFGNDLKELTKEVKGIVDLYNGVSTIKSFLTGLASLIIAISAIGASVIWIIKSVK